MTEWHLWSPGASVPIVYEDPVLLQAALSQFAATDVIVVYTYKRIDAGVVVYNGAGGPPLPPMPSPSPVGASVSITHWKKSP